MTPLVALAGLSMSGYLALELMRRAPERPDAVTAALRDWLAR